MSAAPHPILRYSRWWWVYAIVAMTMSAVSAWAGLWVSLFPCLPLAILSGYAAIDTARAGEVLQAHNEAYQRTLAGDFDGAARLLDEAQPYVRSRYLERALWTQRTLIALYRGDLAAVEAAAAAALAKPTRAATRVIEDQLIADVYALRGLARALLGDAARALEDAAFAESFAEAPAPVLGRALLTRLVVAAKRVDLTELRRLVIESRKGRLVEELAPRERVLFRDYRRLAFMHGSGAYRALSDPSSSPEAEYLRSFTLADPTPEPSADPRAVARVLRERRKAAGKLTFRKTYVNVALWLGVLVLAVTIWTLFTGAPADPPPPDPLQDGTTSLLTWLLFLLPAFLAVWRVRRTRNRQRALGRAQRSVATGDDAAARAVLEPIRKKSAPALSAQADLLLAGLEYAAARFEACIALTTHGLGRLPGGQLRAMHSDLLIPALAELRAAALAALGRIEEARAELVVLLAECPTYAFRARAEHRVALLCAVQRGDLEAAQVVARARPAASLALREEILGDLVLGEEERVAEDLAGSPELAHWIEVVAPGLAARV